MSFRELIQDYLKKAQKYSDVRFIFEFTVLAFILKIVSAIIFSTLLSSLGFADTKADINLTESLIKGNIVWAFASIPVFASLETLIGQAFFSFIVSRFTKNTTKIIVFSAIGFTVLHWDLFQIAAIWPIGFILSWIYVTKLKEGFKKAFFITTAVHTLHNILAAYLVFLTISH